MLTKHEMLSRMIKMSKSITFVQIINHVRHTHTLQITLRGTPRYRNGGGGGGRHRESKRNAGDDGKATHHCGSMPTDAGLMVG